mgnify:FL=1
MKKRTKLLSAVTAGTMALGVMCFGFAQWNTEISGTGTVSANGKWDVKITDAAITGTSNGTTVDGEAETVQSTGNAVVYPLRLHIRSFDGCYVAQVDDLNGKEEKLTQSELEDYTILYETTYGSQSFNYFSSGQKNWGVCQFKAKITNPEVVNNATKLNTSWANDDNGAREGTLVGYAVMYSYKGSTMSKVDTTNENLKVTYVEALDAAKSGKEKTVYKAELNADNTAATYDNTVFSLGGAWAEYSLTVTNNGTVNANLANCKFSTSELSDSFVVDTPEVKDEVLAPGESATVTFVVKAADKAELNAEAQSFSVSMNYVQDTVDSAPSATYSK